MWPGHNKKAFAKKEIKTMQGYELFIETRVPGNIQNLPLNDSV